MPYSAIPIPICGLFTDEKDAPKDGPEIGSFWHYPILNVNLAKEVPHQCWTSIAEWNKAYMQPLVGQAIWKERLAVFQKLEEARASEVAKAAALP